MRRSVGLLERIRFVVTGLSIKLVLRISWKKLGWMLVKSGLSYRNNKPMLMFHLLLDRRKLILMMLMQWLVGLREKIKLMLKLWWNRRTISWKLGWNSNDSLHLLIKIFYFLITLFDTRKSQSQLLHLHSWVACFPAMISPRSDMIFWLPHFGQVSSWSPSISLFARTFMFLSDNNVYFIKLYFFIWVFFNLLISDYINHWLKLE